MLIINNRFLSLYDYNFLIEIKKIFSVKSRICGSRNLSTLKKELHRSLINHREFGILFFIVFFLSSVHHKIKDHGWTRIIL
jgi:hypothetical protein